MKTKEGPFQNALIEETSPYLLQHANNPVDWRPWSQEAFELAKEQDKLVLISIGYSACHWCHVMEHETFEDVEAAAFMNQHFINIKVDREERPDIDQIYMNAVQLMTGRGGWPLNCITLPDGKPVFGGTYFPKENWIKSLEKLVALYKEDPAIAKDYATKLTNGVQQMSLILANPTNEDFSRATLKALVKKWSEEFDNKEGGRRHPPKFPMPNNYQFLLQYGHLYKDTKVLDHVFLTLDKMAFGGIYDQIGGGFARYSTDHLWKVPHFEKMLYDNAQLISLYAKAFQKNPKPLYKEIVFETIDFVKRELSDKNGAFYSALDADSEGEEGKYYVWEKEELKELLGEEFELASTYFNFNSAGEWEHNYIPLRKKSNDEIAEMHGITKAELSKAIESIKKRLFEFRSNRIRPGLDDKALTSWNALMIKACCDAYATFGGKSFLHDALANATFLLEKQQKKEGGLLHNFCKGSATIEGYLEDYCFTIEAFLALYEATFDVRWIQEADALAQHAIDHFYDAQSRLFYFTSDQAPPLISRTIEYTDNVIPASNSSMARALFRLGVYLQNAQYDKIAREMMSSIVPQMNHGPAYSNWGMLLMELTFPFYEIAITGANCMQLKEEFSNYYLPNALFLGAETQSSLPLLKGKFTTKQPLIFVCENKTCKAPVNRVEDAYKQTH